MPPPEHSRRTVGQAFRSAAHPPLPPPSWSLGALLELPFTPRASVGTPQKPVCVRRRWAESRGVASCTFRRLVSRVWRNLRQQGAEGLHILVSQVAALTGVASQEPRLPNRTDRHTREVAEWPSCDLLGRQTSPGRHGDAVALCSLSFLSRLVFAFVFCNYYYYYYYYCCCCYYYLLLLPIIIMIIIIMTLVTRIVMIMIIIMILTII